MFNDKTVLITGGTGSFGKKMVEAILQEYKPRRLIVFSRDELKQFEMSQRWSTSKYPCIRYFIGDVRDKERLLRAFDGVDYVIHAAALKQVPAAEYNPSEAIKTNVLGAMNIIEAALTANVKKVVALSTDKACNPINLYGATKLCSDKLFTAANVYRGSKETIFAVVRYGNVVGSRGSVIPFFLERSKTGVLPITDPQMTRFWITIEQGVRFVLNVFEIARGGEIFVPKIPSMKITDLASAVAPECRQEVVGIRPGEKIHELLISRDDARHTWEFDHSYVIAQPHAAASPALSYPNVQKCAEDFEYNSGTNPWMMSVVELRSIVAQVAHDIAEGQIRWSMDEVPK
ncbi:UDP-N-acetylglucosamine 4,6-dehydratase (inverting) [Candidatus Uhrbacteria bacterium]|nr:UDP-N-acetylglucosamine 4,6-dehydratase (inverting) [Candidatus Uhrbacteria bacterium]